MSRLACRAFMIDARSGAQTEYRFEAEPDVFQQPADEAVEEFFAYLNETHYIERPIQYELNSAFSNKELQVVTALGSLILSNEDVPFMVMISQVS